MDTNEQVVFTFHVLSVLHSLSALAAMVSKLLVVDKPNQFRLATISVESYLAPLTGESYG